MLFASSQRHQLPGGAETGVPEWGYACGHSHPPPLIRPGVGVIWHHAPPSDLCKLAVGGTATTSASHVRLDHGQLRHRRHQAVMLLFNLRVIRRARGRGNQTAYTMAPAITQTSDTRRD